MTEANLLKFDHPKTFPGGTGGPTKNIDLIGSAVLTFIGYKQTHKHPDKQSIYILEIHGASRPSF